ncbi:MAG: ABC transporter permease [Gemmatirosa sp.]|nr:ABC transporter permease [Gemmatirosa sp.]
MRSFVRPILFLARAEVLHIVRDRATLAQALVLPLVQLLLLSQVATFEVRSTPTYVVDLDRSDASRGVVTRLTATGLFDVVGASASPAAADDALLRGRATVVLTLPHDFEADLTRGHDAPIGIAVNAEKGAAAGIVQSYVAQVLAAYGDELAQARRPADTRPRPSVGRLEVRTRGWYNPTLNYQHYMVPGLLVALVTMIGTLLAAQNVAREKEVGTLEQLNATPITRAQFIAAKLLPLWVLGLTELALGLVVARLAFGVPMRGSLLLLFGVASIYLVVALSLGLWISTLVETQQQAMFVTFFLLMIYLLMSGLFTPIDSMPRWVQLLSQLNPVRHFVAVSRGVLVKGATPRDVVQPVAALVVSAAVMLTVAVRQYSKRAA